MALDKDTGFIGSGNVFFDRLHPVTGASTGFRLLGNTKKLAFTEKSTIKPRVSFQRDTAGQTLQTASRKSPSELEFSLDSINATNLAMVVLGDAASYNLAASPVAETVIAAHDVWLPIGAASNLGEVVTVKDVTDTTTYAENIDYLLNRRIGWIMVLSGGAIASAAQLHVTGNALASTGQKVTAATRPTIRGALLLDGINEGNGKACILRAWQVEVTPKSPIDFLNDNWTEIGFSGYANTPEGKTYPYAIELPD